MELPSKLLEQIAFNTRPKIEEHMLIVMDRSTHEEHLSQSLQTNNKQFEITVTFLTGYNGILNVTNSKKSFYLKKTITDEEGFFKNTISPGAYEIESLNKEIKRIVIHEGHFTQANYPFEIKPNFSTLGSIKEISPKGTIISFLFKDSMRDLLRFSAGKVYEEFNLPTIAVDILSFDNIFLEGNIAQVIIFKGKRSGIFHNFTMAVDPRYKYIEKLRGGVQWYMVESNDSISSISFGRKIENNELVSFNGQSITFRLSIKEIYFSTY